MDVVISKTSSDDTFVIGLEGELDLYTAPRLDDALADGIASGHRTLVVDLRRVGFLDSAALGVLLGGLRRMRSERKGDLRLVLDDAHLAKMFRITGFDEVFNVYKTLEEAVRPDRSES